MASGRNVKINPCACGVKVRDALHCGRLQMTGWAFSVKPSKAWTTDPTPMIIIPGLILHVDYDNEISFCCFSAFWHSPLQQVLGK